MPSNAVGQAPSLSTFLKSLKHSDVASSVQLLISLLKRRQIKSSRPCAIATAQLLLRVVAMERIRDAQKLIDRIRDVGRQLIAAQPREMAVGNIVRRVLGVVREVADRDEERTQSAAGDASSSLAASTELSRSTLPSTTSLQSALGQTGSPDQDLDGSTDSLARRPPISSATSYAGQGPSISSLLSFLEHPPGPTPTGTPPTGIQPPNPALPSPKPHNTKEKIDIKAEVIDGIKELLDELEIVDSQIAESALDHIHSNETILTHTSSQSVQRFLLTAARKRKFTLIHAEAFPNHHEATHATIVHGGGGGGGGGQKKSGQSGDDNNDDNDAAAANDPHRWKALTALGITVILVPDTAVFALMPRVNKVLLAPHAVLADGSLLAAAGAATISAAARAHRVPLVVLSGIYKLSPVYPFDPADLIEYADPGSVVAFDQGQFIDRVAVANPLVDLVDADLVDLYITNLGGCAPSFLYRIVADHYATEDVDLSLA